MSLNVAQLMAAPEGPGVIGAVEAGNGITISASGVISTVSQLLQLQAGTGIRIDNPQGPTAIISVENSGTIVSLAAGPGISIANPSGPVPTISASSPTGISTVSAGQNIEVTNPSGPTVTVAAPQVLPLAGGTMTGPILMPSGSASVPSLAFSTESNTGIFFDAAKDSICLGNSGVLRQQFDGNGQVIFGKPDLLTTANSPFTGAVQTWTNDVDNPGSSFIACRATNQQSAQVGGHVTRRCRGSSISAPQPIQVGDRLGEFFSYGCVGNSWNSVTGSAMFVSTGTSQITNSQIVFATDSDLSTDFSLTEWVRVGPTGQLGPMTSNSNDLGANDRKWRSLFVVNSPYVGNDEDFVSSTPLQGGLGLTLLNALNPVSFVRDVEYNEVIGQPTNPQDPVDQWVFENQVTPIPGTTVHWGILAQDLQAAQSTLGLQGLLGVYGGGENPGEPLYVSQEELIAPMIQAIQDLSAQLNQLQQDFDDYVAAHP